jgi:hypothetical protein
MVEKMPDLAGLAPQTPWPTSSGTVEEMRSDNLQLYVPNLVENMHTGGLQRHLAENMKSGSLQVYDSYGDKERLPPIQDEKIDPETVSKRKLLGLSRRVFWLFAASIVLVVTGAVVGGVVGTQTHRSNTFASAATAGAILQVSSTQSAAPSRFATSSTGTITTASTTSATSPNVTSSLSTQTPTTTTLPFITPTRANPVDVDGNYFVNCNNTKGGLASGLAYYKNLTPGSNIGHGPDDYINVTNGSYVTWENGGVGTSHHSVPFHKS